MRTLATFFSLPPNDRQLRWAQGLPPAVYMFYFVLISFINFMYDITYMYIHCIIMLCNCNLYVHLYISSSIFLCILYLYCV